jgi:hypothetical protein
LISSPDSIYDLDTIPDEDYRKITGSNLRGKLTSWPNNKDTRADPRKLKIEPAEKEGPNINIKQPRRSYGSYEEKNYFFNKIKSKQKTEVCLN